MTQSEAVQWQALRREIDELRRQLAGVIAREGNPQERVEFRMARIVTDSWPTSSSTTSTTSTSSTTTTPPTCSVRVYKILFVDAQFPLASGVKQLTTIERSQEHGYAAAKFSLALAVGDLVAVKWVNGRWWIEQTFGSCPQASSNTTTTTTTTTTAAPS